MTQSTEQPEALRLADWLNQGGWPSYVPQEAAAELRRQHARIAELEAQIAAAQQAVQPVAWAAVYFAGPRMGKIYTTCDTEQQCNAYIAQVHQSNDSITLTAKPIYTHPTQQGMDAIAALQKVRDIAVSALLTGSLDRQDWIDDMDRIAAQVKQG